VINIPKNFQEQELTNDYIIRRKAVDFGIPLITNLQLAQRFVESIKQKDLQHLEIRSWSEYRSKNSIARSETTGAGTPRTNEILVQ
jgi:carbamoyl-phosphate synthase large subunit